MLQEASPNPGLALEWRRPQGRYQGYNSMLDQGYSEDDIKNGFRIDIGFPRAALGDRLKMLMAAVFSIAFPLCLLMAIVLLMLVMGRSTLVASGAGFVWLLVGDLVLLGVLLALVRRITFKKRNDKSHLTVSASAQPELHSFINHIAKVLNGPVPTSVKLDAEVGLVLRPRSLMDAVTGTGPQLIIGLPLLYGLSARQLAGVIAHAYAGYSREARLYGYPILSTVDRWLFAQTAGGRAKAWAKQAFSSNSRSLLDRVLAPFEWLVQGLFYVIYRIISALTFDVSRRVDMAGDVYSARIAGSTEFRSTQFRLRSLHYGQQHAVQELLNSWRNNKLSDNIPALVVDHADTLQLSLRPRLIQEMEELVTPLTRSRIVDLGRIVQVEHIQEEGACYLLGAAVSLLRNADKIARAVTLKQYAYLGIQQPDLYGSQKSQSILKAERERARLRHVFCGLERGVRVVRIDEFERLSLEPVASRVAQLSELREQLNSSESQIEQLADSVRGYEYRKNILHTRKVVENSKGKAKKLAHDLEVQWLALIKEQSEVKVQLSEFEQLFTRRISLALSLALGSNQVQEYLQMSRSELYSHCLRLADAHNFMHRCCESIQRLRGYTQVLGQLLVEAGSEGKYYPQIGTMCYRYQKYLLIELDALMKIFSGVIYPLGGVSFMGAGGLRGNNSEFLTIADVIGNDVADIDSASSCPEACHRVANSVCQYLDSFIEQLQQRVAGLLTSVDYCYGLGSSNSSPK